MKEFQRKEIIDKLTNNLVESIICNTCPDDSLCLEILVRYGHKGFENFTDEELIESYKEIFGARL